MNRYTMPHVVNCRRCHSVMRRFDGYHKCQSCGGKTPHRTVTYQEICRLLGTRPNQSIATQDARDAAWLKTERDSTRWGWLKKARQS